MMTNTKKQESKLNGLDHLRTFAIVSVFLFHYGRLFPHPEWINTVSKFGWTGVDLFFVLSGYLISSQLFYKIVQGETISIKVFFVKRFFRIIPAYLFVLTLYFLFPSCRERESLAPLWKYLTFTQNLGLDLRTQGTFSHAWSLCIEEQFYLLLPLTLIGLVYYGVIKKGGILLVVLFAGCFFTRLLLWHSVLAPFKDNDDFWAYWYKWVYYPTYCRLDGLLVGVLVAAIFQFKSHIKTLLNQYSNFILLLGVVVLAIAYIVCFNQESFVATIYGFTLISLGYGLIVVGAVCAKTFLYQLKSKVTTTIATLSYSIYLIHKIAIHITQENLARFNIEKDSNLMFLICTITTFFCALLIRQLIEKPFMRWRDRLLTMTK